MHTLIYLLKKKDDFSHLFPWHQRIFAIPKDVIFVHSFLGGFFASTSSITAWILNSICLKLQMV